MGLTGVLVEAAVDVPDGAAVFGCTGYWELEAAAVVGWVFEYETISLKLQTIGVVP